MIVQLINGDKLLTTIQWKENNVTEMTGVTKAANVGDALQALQERQSLLRPRNVIASAVGTNEVAKYCTCAPQTNSSELHKRTNESVGVLVIARERAQKKRAPKSIGPSGALVATSTHRSGGVRRR